MKSARMVAFEALQKINVDDGYSNIVLDHLLCGNELKVQDQALVSAIVYGVLENRITLDYIISMYSTQKIKKISPKVLDLLRMGVFQILYMDKIPSFAAVNECVSIAKKVGQVKATGFINAVLRKVEREHKGIIYPKNGTKEEYYSVKYSCPVWIVKIWLEQYGKEVCLGILESLKGRPPLTIRINNLKTTQKELKKQLELQNVEINVIEGFENSLNLSRTNSVKNLYGYDNGYFHVQDMASQICCEIASPKPNQRVIDVCSAPGGKTFTMAEIMENKGEIISCDLYPEKVNLIQKGASRLSLDCVTAINRDALKFSNDLEKADVVLCDVPCSGLGILRRKPEIRYKESSVADDLPSIQYQILKNSSELVKNGGKLVYSTCTLNKCENNYVVQRFLDENSDFEPVKIELPDSIKRTIQEQENCITLFPQENGTDGFFVALMKRKEL